MRGRTCCQLLQYLGLPGVLLCLLAGCGGPSGSNETSGPVSRLRQLSLQLLLAPIPVSTARLADPGDG